MGSPFFVDVRQQFAFLVYQKGGLPKPISTTFRITPAPVIVEDMPNLNLSLNEKVRFYMGMCASAIVLATEEDETVAAEKRTRPNVENEVGLMQNAPNIGNRIIYLKELGVKFASNYQEKVWIPFEKGSVQGAFIPLLKELRAFGLIGWGQ